MTISREKQDGKETGKERRESSMMTKTVVRGWEALTQRLRKKDLDLLKEEYSVSLEDVPKVCGCLT